MSRIIPLRHLAESEKETISSYYDDFGCVLAITNSTLKLESESFGLCDNVLNGELEVIIRFGNQSNNSNSYQQTLWTTDCLKNCTCSSPLSSQH